MILPAAWVGCTIIAHTKMIATAFVASFDESSSSSPPSHHHRRNGTTTSAEEIDVSVVEDGGGGVPAEAGGAGGAVDDGEGRDDGDEDDVSMTTDDDDEEGRHLVVKFDELSKNDGIVFGEDDVDSDVKVECDDGPVSDDSTKSSFVDEYDEFDDDDDSHDYGILLVHYHKTGYVLSRRMTKFVMDLEYSARDVIPPPVDQGRVVERVVDDATGRIIGFGRMGNWVTNYVPARRHFGYTGCPSNFEVRSGIIHL